MKRKMLFTADDLKKRLPKPIKLNTENNKLKHLREIYGLRDLIRIQHGEFSKANNLPMERFQMTVDCDQPSTSQTYPIFPGYRVQQIQAMFEELARLEKLQPTKKRNGEPFPIPETPKSFIDECAPQYRFLNEFSKDFLDGSLTEDERGYLILETFLPKVFIDEPLGKNNHSAESAHSASVQNMRAHSSWTSQYSGLNQMQQDMIGLAGMVAPNPFLMSGAMNWQNSLAAISALTSQQSALNQMQSHMSSLADFVVQNPTSMSATTNWPNNFGLGLHSHQQSFPSLIHNTTELRNSIQSNSNSQSSSDCVTPEEPRTRFLRTSRKSQHDNERIFHTDSSSSLLYSTPTGTSSSQSDLFSPSQFGANLALKTFHNPMAMDPTDQQATTVQNMAAHSFWTSPYSAVNHIPNVLDLAGVVAQNPISMNGATSWPNNALFGFNGQQSILKKLRSSIQSNSTTQSSSNCETPEESTATSTSTFSPVRGKKPQSDNEVNSHSDVFTSLPHPTATTGTSCSQSDLFSPTQFDVNNALKSIHNSDAVNQHIQQAETSQFTISSSQSHPTFTTGSLSNQSDSGLPTQFGANSAHETLYNPVAVNQIDLQTKASQITVPACPPQPTITTDMLSTFNHALASSIPQCNQQLLQNLFASFQVAPIAPTKSNLGDFDVGEEAALEQHDTQQLGSTTENSIPEEGFSPMQPNTSSANITTSYQRDQPNLNLQRSFGLSGTIQGPDVPSSASDSKCISSFGIDSLLNRPELPKTYSSFSLSDQYSTFHQPTGPIQLQKPVVEQVMESDRDISSLYMVNENESADKMEEENVDAIPLHDESNISVLRRDPIQPQDIGVLSVLQEKIVVPNANGSFIEDTELVGTQSDTDVVTENSPLQSVLATSILTHETDEDVNNSLVQDSNVGLTTTPQKQVLIPCELKALKNGSELLQNDAPSSVAVQQDLSYQRLSPNLTNLLDENHTAEIEEEDDHVSLETHVTSSSDLLSDPVQPQDSGTPIDSQDNVVSPTTNESLMDVFQPNETSLTSAVAAGASSSLEPDVETAIQLCDAQVGSASQPFGDEVNIRRDDTDDVQTSHLLLAIRSVQPNFPSIEQQNCPPSAELHKTSVQDETMENSDMPTHADKLQSTTMSMEVDVEQDVLSEASTSPSNTHTVLQLLENELSVIPVSTTEEKQEQQESCKMLEDKSTDTDSLETWLFPIERSEKSKSAPPACPTSWTAPEPKPNSQIQLFESGEIGRMNQDRDIDNEFQPQFGPVLQHVEDNTNFSFQAASSAVLGDDSTFEDNASESRKGCILDSEHEEMEAKLQECCEQISLIEHTEDQISVPSTDLAPRSPGSVSSFISESSTSVNESDILEITSGEDSEYESSSESVDAEIEQCDLSFKTAKPDYVLNPQVEPHGNSFWKNMAREKEDEKGDDNQDEEVEGEVPTETEESKTLQEIEHSSTFTTVMPDYVLNPRVGSLGNNFWALFKTVDEKHAEPQENRKRQLEQGSSLEVEEEKAMKDEQIKIKRTKKRNQ